MIQASLFSGIGGFDLASEWAGWENAFHCEINTFGRKILNYYWPNAISYDDITKTDFTIWRGRIDVLTGGFPCQPFSLAGKRLGTADHRNLWPEYHRAIREIQPTWVVGENVPGLLNWSGGLVFEQVQADLENEGYEVWPVTLPACSVNAPHRRDRVWFVAYNKNFKRGRDNCRCRGLCEEQFTPDPSSDRRQRAGEEPAIEKGLQPRPEPAGELAGRSEGLCDNGNASNPDGQRQPGEEYRQEKSRRITKEGIPNNWQNFPTQRPIRVRDDGVSNKLLIFVVKKLYENISNTSKENRIKNLQEVRERISTPEIWEKIRRLYSLESKAVLLQTMQLYSEAYGGQVELSPFSEDFSKPLLQHLSKYGEFRYSPQGQRLEKQRNLEFGDALPFLPHEVALAAGRFEAAIAKFETWHMKESIKAYGNAIVPQVAYQIFKAINEYESNL